MVTVRAWERWLLFEQVRTARQAWQHAQQVEDWTRDLNPAERAAMRWALAETETQNESNPNHTDG